MENTQDSLRRAMELKKDIGSTEVSSERLKIKIDEVEALMALIQARASLTRDVPLGNSELRSTENLNNFLEDFASASSRGKKSLFRSDLFNVLLLPDTVEFIQKSYRLLLKREADAHGLRYYQRKLEGLKFSRIDLFLELGGSLESRRQRGFGPLMSGIIRALGLVFIGRNSGFTRLFLKTWRKFASPVLQHQYAQASSKLQLEDHLRSTEDNLKILSSVLGHTRKSLGELEVSSASSLQTIDRLLNSVQALDERQKIYENEFDRFRNLVESEQNRAEFYKKKFEWMEEKLSKIEFNAVNSPSLEKSAIPRELTREDKSDHGDRFDQYYLKFEDHFRGPEQEIMRRMEVYLPKLDASLGMCLDIGCGRGEWLQLLSQNGFAAMGIDINRKSIDFCQGKNLSVQLRDALEMLRSLPDDSLALVSAFHVVEHMPWGTVLEMIRETFRVLKVGGSLILETPNPENVLVGSCYFYHDPTHKNPIVPAVLDFTVKHFGFQDVEIMRLQQKDLIPRGELGAWFDPIANSYNASQDFAVIGKKGASV